MNLRDLPSLNSIWSAVILDEKSATPVQIGLELELNLWWVWWVCKMTEFFLDFFDEVE